MKEWKLVKLSMTLGLTLSACCVFAAGDPDLSITVGAKVWSNKWSTWDVSPAAPGYYATYVQNYPTGTETAFIPGISVRYLDFLASGSYFINKSYNVAGISGNLAAKRKEGDFSLGYYVLPSAAILVGYKQVDETFGSSSATSAINYKGPFVGFTGGAALGQRFSLYGNVAFGRLRSSFPSYYNDPTLLSSSNPSADYRLIEAGIAYTFNVHDSMPSLKSLVATFGYRSQVLSANVTLPEGGVAITSSGAFLAPRSTQLRDVTEGPTIGLSTTF